jgi:ketosteroid isomerase-like protein
MSEKENVALVRKLLEMFANREHETVFEYYDPEIVWDASRVADFNPDIAGVFHGHDAVRQYWRTWLEAWRDLDFEVEDVIAHGDAVAALIRNQRQWGRHSGVETEMPPYVIVFTINEGKVTRWASYPDREEGLRAAGIAV